MLIIFIDKYYLLIRTLSPPFRRANNSITSLLAILIHPFDAFFQAAILLECRECIYIY